MQTSLALMLPHCRYSYRAQT